MKIKMNFKKPRFDLTLFLMILAVTVGITLMCVLLGCIVYMLFMVRPALYVLLGFLSVTTIVYLIVRKYQDD
jgi:hypothetical protein